ncbi:MAG: quinolinate synthase NadA [Spirochaetales bacterium]|nr:quinolinate synthase NadA [Spirochaetales bacterium]
MTVDQLYNQLKKIRFEKSENRDDLRRFCEEKIPLINEINELKAQKNALILAHTYVSPEIIYGVSDHTGDSYGLSKNARDAKEELIIFSAVRFMGETAKILSPDKRVIVPADDGGCTLADSITAADVEKLKRENPDYTFVCYINTTVDVKAACDIVVTSSNVYDIIENLDTDKIFFVPDRLMGLNIISEMEKRGVKKDIKLWTGTCYVHEEFDPALIESSRRMFPGLRILAHPECDPQITGAADYVGSTTQMYDYVVDQGREPTYLVFSECGLASRLEAEKGPFDIVGSCAFCKYMKSNSLENILRALKNPREEDFIQVDPAVRERALQSLNRMFEEAEK